MLFRSFVSVGTDNSKAFGVENFGQAAHADAANAHKVDLYRFIKIDLIHQNPSYSIKLIINKCITFVTVHILHGTVTYCYYNRI